MAVPIEYVPYVVAIAWAVCSLAPAAAGQSTEPHLNSEVVQSQENAGPRSAQSASLSAGESPQEAFNVGVAKLPVHFRGNTVEWVLRFGTLAPRQAFQTDADYAARRRAFRSEVFAFVADRHEFRYDRAAETVSVSVHPVETRVGAWAGYYAFNIHRTKLSATSRAGPSKWSRDDRPLAAGRTAVLSTRRAWKQTQIVTYERAFELVTQPLVFKLKMSRDHVALAKSNMRVALVCLPRLDQFESAGDAGVREATGVDARADGSWQFLDENVTYLVTLRCNLLQVWLFDFTTGEVYGRFTPQGAVVPRD